MLRKFLAGFVGAHRLSRLYLADQLVHFGIAKGRIPAACVRELADDCMKAVRLTAKRTHRKRREMAAEILHDRADDVLSILEGFDPFDAGPNSTITYVEAVLRKHGVLEDDVIVLPSFLASRAAPSSVNASSLPRAAPRPIGGL